MIQRLSVRTQVNDLIADLGKMGMKQAPFAVRQAIDATAKDAGQALRNVMRQRFRHSSKGWNWISKHVRVMKTGDKMAAREIGKSQTSRSGGGDMRAWIAIIPPAAKGEHAGFSRYRGSLIAAMEAGGPTPGPRDVGGRAGLGRYVIPITRYHERPRFPLKMFPINLGLSARQSIEGPMRGGWPRGKHRTFVTPVSGSGNAVIFQRFGRKGAGKGLGGSGDDNLMALFWTQNATRMPAKRYFFSTVQMITRTRLGPHLKRSMDHALFSRGRYQG